MANTKKRCRYCKSYKLSDSMLLINGGSYCDIECAKDYGFKNKEKGKAKKYAAQKKHLKLNDKKYRTEQAQAAFNKYIRFRDEKEPCISCGRSHEGQYHAGHYKSVRSSPELRFNELNCHKQCAPCNNHLSGNIANYRINLITKIGVEGVEFLEGNHEAKKYSCEDLLAIEKKYKELIK